MGLHPAQQERAKSAGYRLGFGDGLIIGHEKPDLPVDEIGYDADAVRNVLLRQYAHNHYKSSFTRTAQHLPVQIQLTGETGAEFEDQFFEYVRHQFMTGYDDGFQDGVIAAADGVAVGTPAERWRRPAAVDLAKELTINYFSSIGVEAVHVPYGFRIVKKSKAQRRIESVRVRIRPHLLVHKIRGVKRTDTMFAYDLAVHFPEGMGPQRSEEMERLEVARSDAKTDREYDRINEKLNPLRDEFAKLLEDYSKRFAYKLAKWLTNGGVRVLSAKGEEDGVYITFYA